MAPKTKKSEIWAMQQHLRDEPSKAQGSYEANSSFKTSVSNQMRACAIKDIGSY